MLLGEPRPQLLLSKPKLEGDVARDVVGRSSPERVARVSDGAVARSSKRLDDRTRIISALAGRRHFVVLFRVAAQREVGGVMNVMVASRVRGQRAHFWFEGRRDVLSHLLPLTRTGRRRRSWVRRAWAQGMVLSACASAA